jgi:plasmid replication initiation protein
VLYFNLFKYHKNGLAMKKPELVVQSNALIQASYTLQLSEQRLIRLAIVWALETQTGITPETPLLIDARTYATQFGVTLDAAYLALKGAVDTLFERQVTFWDVDKDTGKPERIKTRWVSEVRYIDEVARVKVIFTPAVVRQISRQGAEFVQYTINHISGLSSAYAIRLYELLIQWRSVGKTPLVKLAGFRGKMGLTEEYKNMSDFKKYVLDLAVSQINEHADIFVAYEQVKLGRVIEGFIFTLKPKKQPTDVTPKPKKPEPKPKSIKKEEQLDWMTSDILDRFISLSPSQKQTILDRVEQTLKGATRARFKVARVGNTKQLVTEFSLDINDALMRSAT